MMHMPFSTRRDTLLAVSICGSLVLLSGVLAERAYAQKESVKPGINESFKDPKVTDFVERFEREGREIFDKCHEAVEACGIKEGMAIADVGAGTGLYTRRFAAKTGPTGKVYAVDIAQKFVDHIIQSCQEEKLHNVVGIVCTADSAELPANSIDLAFICDTYHHFEFPESTMRTIHKALRPGGIVCLIDFERIEGVSSTWTLDHVRAGKDAVRKEVEEVGFELVDEVKGLFKDNYFLRFRKR